MSEPHLTPYLQRVLDAFQDLTPWIEVDPLTGSLDDDMVDDLALLLGEQPEDVYQAILGLRARDVLMEESVEFEGIQELTFWTVHPQCRRVQQ